MSQEYGVWLRSNLIISIPKQLLTIFLPDKQKKKDLLIPTDQGQSLAHLDDKKPDLRSVMDRRVAKKPWAISNKNGKIRDNAKSAFPNMLQLFSSLPNCITHCVVDAMWVLRMIHIRKPKPWTIRHWSNHMFEYMRYLPGDVLNLVFDNYDYQYQLSPNNW